MWKDKNSDCFKTIANIYTSQQLAAMGYRLKVIRTKGRTENEKDN